MKAKALYIIGLIVLFLLTATNLKIFAQEVKLRFEHLGVEQGLTDNTAICIMQDRKGYLWFGTYNGLNKYDGYNFTTYQFDPRDSTTIGGNVIRGIWQDNDGIIWVNALGTDLFTFDRTTEKFARFNLAAPLSLPSVAAFNRDNEGNMWFGGNNGELAQGESIPGCSK